MEFDYTYMMRVFLVVAGETLLIFSALPVIGPEEFTIVFDTHKITTTVSFDEVGVASGITMFATDAASANGGFFSDGL